MATATTLRWHICSRALAMLLAVLPLARAAVVTGHVELVASRDSAVRKGDDYSGVVVWLEPDVPSDVPLPHAHVVMLQKNKTFSPHILAVSVGSTVDFPNLDPIFHNAFSNFEGEIFDVALYPPGTSRSVRFTRPGIVRVFCNIHPSMSAVIVVVPTANYAVSDKSGAFRISNVAAGNYTLHVFHERATPETLEKLTRPAPIAEGESQQQLGDLTISESGYLPVTHKNKYGRAYREPADEDRPYSN